MTALPLAAVPSAGAGSLLATRLDRPPVAERGTALLVPGPDPAEGARLERLAAALGREGIAVLHLPEAAEGAALAPGALAGAIHAAGLAAAAGGRRVPLLVGIGAGAGAVLLAAEGMPGVQAIVLIDPELAHEGGTPHALTAERCCRALTDYRHPLLLLHAPDHAAREADALALYTAAAQPKTLAALTPGSADAAAAAIAAWAGPICLAPPLHLRDIGLPAVAEGGVLHLAEIDGHRYTQAMRSGRHLLVADEPASMGGEDLGPPPFQLLLSALAACTSMTMRMYAERKGWAVGRIGLELTVRSDPATRVMHIERRIALGDGLDAAARARLLEIADRCPVHRALSVPAEIVTVDTGL